MRVPTKEGRKRRVGGEIEGGWNVRAMAIQQRRDDYVVWGLFVVQADHLELVRSKKSARSVTIG